MTITSTYPRRLIEVDLPIKEISANSRREKSTRHGHLSTLHLWWARRPLAACRAVTCASLWFDPGDERCPDEFLATSAEVMEKFALAVQRKKTIAEICAEHWDEWNSIKAGDLTSSPIEFRLRLRTLLLHFISAFSDFKASVMPEFVEVAERLTGASHAAVGIGGESGPLVVDPFAGGGAIPLEALRVGAKAFASDANPVAVLLNTVTLSYAPKYGDQLVDTFEKAAKRVAALAKERLLPFYPKSREGAQPLAYVWARQIDCEGPQCGARIPLLRSLWLANKGKKKIALRMVVLNKSVQFELLENVRASDVGTGTSAGGAATCPVCGYTTPVESVRAQLTEQKGGAARARLLAVLERNADGRNYRLPTQNDLDGVSSAEAALAQLVRETDLPPGVPLVPDGKLNHLRGFFNVVLYGNTEWGHLFTPRQLLALATLSDLVRKLPDSQIAEGDAGLAAATRAVLALLVDRVAVRCTANCIWDATTECVMQIFNQGQSLPARWEFAEMCPVLDEGSGWNTSITYASKVLRHLGTVSTEATVNLASATQHPLPDDCGSVIFTDPPYYAAIPYADLSDFFYSWLRRSLAGHGQELLKEPLVPKEPELVSLAHRAAMYRHKDNNWFEEQMYLACVEARRVCAPAGLGVWVFANKETEAWEAMLSALIGAGWVVTASWPVDTESGNRLRAKNSAALASSVHLVCRPRENPDGSLITDTVGDWRSVLKALPERISTWMERLADEGVVGADAIFACLGPALEIFSQYAKVEKVSGEVVELREFLEQVWAALAQVALSMIFEGADPSGLEEDARVTAMWLWTLSTGANDATVDARGKAKKGKEAGLVLDFDAARKIAQGLGVSLGNLDSVVRVRGEKARLLDVSERAGFLFPKKSSKQTRKQGIQRTLFEDLGDAVQDVSGSGGTLAPGRTELDRVHQAMLLFAAGRSEALKRFLLDDGIGRNAAFWKLAQALSALYPSGSDEKRWVDGVLSRKKGLGFG